jgi:peroxiredoxin
MMTPRVDPLKGRKWVRIAAPARWLASGLLVAALSSLVGAEAPTLAALLMRLELRAYPPGTMAPVFSGPALDARRLSIAELRGRVVLLNFWATWCRECRPELPVLDQLHREFAPRGLVVVAINVREGEDAVRRYTKELGLTFPVMLDRDGRIDRAYGVVGLPTTFVVGRDGRAVALAVGAREWGNASGRAIIESLLAEAAPTGAS